LYGSIRASFGASTSATVVVPRSPRFRLVLLLLEGTPAQELAVLRALEALGGAPMRFDFDFLGHHLPT